MSFLDKAKGLAADAAEKAKTLAVDNSDKVKAGIDKAEGLADKATKGKYSSTIGGVGDKAAGLVDGLKKEPTIIEGTLDTSTTTPTTPAAPTATPGAPVPPSSSPGATTQP